MLKDRVEEQRLREGQRRTQRTGKDAEGQGKDREGQGRTGKDRVDEGQTFLKTNFNENHCQQYSIHYKIHSRDDVEERQNRI